jgi:hypothetical protein
MANDRGRSRLFLATGSVTLAVAAATYSYFILKEAPPLSAEEAAADPGMHAEAQRPSAGGGPCQDPLGAIENSPEMDGMRAFAPDAAAYRSVAGMQENSPAVLAAGVMVPGGADPNTLEQRKCTRCAILAGLARLGFTPGDSSRIHNFLWPGSSPDVGRLARLLFRQWQCRTRKAHSLRMVRSAWLWQGETDPRSLAKRADLRR